MDQTTNQTNKKARKDGRANRSLLLRVIFLLCVCGVGLFIPLIWQLYRLQIVQHDYYTELAVDFQTRDVTVTADRGTIYDSNGHIMAISATVYNLILSPRDVIKKQESVDEKAAKDPEKAWDVGKTITNYLVNTLGVDRARVEAKLEKTKSAYEVMITEIEDEEAKEIRTFLRENGLTSALYLTPTSKRYYPNSAIASHVIGFLGYTDTSGDQKVGAYGIEANYEDYLAGQPGRVVTAKNASGTEMLSSYEAYMDANDGDDLEITLDYNIQAMAEQTLEAAIKKYYIQNGGFVIVMDPNTGAIKAMASSPDYDPNNHTAITDATTLEKLQAIVEEFGEDSKEYSDAKLEAQYAQWRNKALNDGYEPGSTFKALVVAAALEEGVVSLDSTYYCPGYASYGGWRISCHKPAGHDMQTLTQALENSCNVALMEIGMKLGADRFWQYLEDYGLMDQTGIDLAGEGKGQFWDEEYFKSEEGISSLAVGSFGQTFKVTPIRMITSFASVINGGHLVTPYVVKSITNEAGSVVYSRETEEVRQVISEQTSEKMRAMLESVVANGTGQNAYNAGYRIGGKTGTSEKRDQAGNDVIVSFMGFAPAEDPQVLVLVGLDTPQRVHGSQYTPGGTYISGGNIAAPVTGALLTQILDYLGVEKQYTTSEEFSGSDVRVPPVTGYDLETAKKELERKNLTYRTVGTGEKVTGQIPAAGASIPGGSSVVIYLGAEVPTDLVKVPKLVGKSPAAVAETLASLGLYVRATGVSSYTSSTSAADQSLEAGTEVARGTVVEVRFVNDSISDYAG